MKCLSAFLAPDDIVRKCDRPAGHDGYHSTARERAEMAKRDAPESGKVYALTGGPDAKCILNGNSWADSVVKKGAR